jgi:hypothetical protein
MASSSDNFRTDIEFIRVLLDCRVLAAFHMHYTCHSPHCSHSCGLKLRSLICGHRKLYRIAEYITFMQKQELDFHICRHSCEHSWFPGRPTVLYINYIFIMLQFYHIRCTKNVTFQRLFMQKYGFCALHSLFNGRSLFKFYLNFKIYRLRCLGLVTLNLEGV